MGQAEILTNLGEGLYQVRVSRSADYAQARIDAAQAGIDKLEPIRDAEQVEIDEAMEEVKAELENIKEAIAKYEDDLHATQSRVDNGGDLGVLRDTNATRLQEAGAGPCAYDQPIRDIGMPHSEWLANFIAANGQEAVTLEIAHANWSTRFAQLQEDYPYMFRAGENVAMIQDFVNRPWAATEGWLNSPTHRGTLLEPEFTYCAIAVWIMPDGLGVCTQIFVATNMDKLFLEQIEKKNELDAEQRKNDLLTLEITALEIRIERLTALLDDLTTDIREVWCADYADNIEPGVRPTCDINGQPGHIILQPTYREPVQAVAPGEQQTEFNCLPAGSWLPIPVMSPAQAAFSWAILPGWQKWRPTYRVGEIVELNANADTCSVILDGAWSVAQSLHINQGTGRLDDVPVDYMTCNAAAFEVGNRVVVEFQSQKWEEPVVIGFETEPKECAGIVALVFGVLAGQPYYPPEGAAICQLSGDMQKVIRTYTSADHPEIGLTHYVSDLHSGGDLNTTWKTRKEAPLEMTTYRQRIFFTKYDATSYFRFGTSDSSSSMIQEGYARMFLCGVNPSWTLTIDLFEADGTYDFYDRPRYVRTRETYLEAVATEDHVLFRRIGSGLEIPSGQMSYDFFTHDGNPEPLERILFTPHSNMMWYDLWWARVVDNHIWYGFNMEFYNHYVGAINLNTKAVVATFTLPGHTDYYEKYQGGTYTGNHIVTAYNMDTAESRDTEAIYLHDTFSLCGYFGMEGAFQSFRERTVFSMLHSQNKVYMANLYGTVQMLDYNPSTCNLEYTNKVFLKDIVGNAVPGDTAIAFRMATTPE